MKKLNTKGFGVVEGLLIVVIIGIIGGAGYYVYAQNQNKTNTYTDSEQSADSEKSIPEGWTLYENKKLVEDRNLGVMFLYPNKYEPSINVNREGEVDSSTGLSEVDRISIELNATTDDFYTLDLDKVEGFTKKEDVYSSQPGLWQDVQSQLNKEKGFRVVKDNAIIWYTQNPTPGTKDVVTTVYALINLPGPQYKSVTISRTLSSGFHKEKQDPNMSVKPTTQAEIDEALAEINQIVSSFNQL